MVSSRSVIVALTQWRKNQGLTQQEVADEMDVTQQVVSELEGKDDCMVSTLLRYADAVDCELTFELGGRGNELFQSKKR